MDRRLLARSAPLALVLALALPATLVACGSDEVDPNTPTGEALERTSTPTPTDNESSDPVEPEVPEDVPQTITVTRTDDAFSPNGERIDVALDEEFLLVIVSDEAGEFHVHSIPEQTVTYKAGTSSHELTIDKPGVVEVESHDPDSVVLQLQVS